MSVLKTLSDCTDGLEFDFSEALIGGAGEFRKFDREHILCLLLATEIVELN